MISYATQGVCATFDDLLLYNIMCMYMLHKENRNTVIKRAVVLVGTARALH